MGQADVIDILKSEKKKGRYCTTRYIADKISDISTNTVSTNLTALKKQNLLSSIELRDVRKTKNGKLITSRLIGYRINDDNEWFYGRQNNKGKS